MVMIICSKMGSAFMYICCILRTAASSNRRFGLKQAERRRERERERD